MKIALELFDAWLACFAGIGEIGGMECLPPVRLGIYPLLPRLTRVVDGINLEHKVVVEINAPVAVELAPSSVTSLIPP